MDETGSRIRDKAHVFLDAYERMNALFEKRFGYSLYFIGGTLLGYVRENDFLANDKDMDVSYFSKYNNVKDVRAELIDIVDTLMDSGEDLYFIRYDYSLVKNYFRWKVDERDRIDVMPSWHQDGMLYRPTFVGYMGSKDIILPLQKRKFYGHDIIIPNDPSTKLANVYGEDWMVPNPDFQKSDRKNNFTNRVVSNQLCYKEKQWILVKKTKQWRDLKFFDKLFVWLIYLRKFPFFRRIMPHQKNFKTNFWRSIRKILTGKYRSVPKQ